jgi:RF-1 domain
MGNSPDHPSALPPDQLLAQCSLRFTRRSGPGGQHRNKVESAAILTHKPTGISAEANERRSQSENREVALQRLRIKLAIEVRSPPAIDVSPSALWQSRLRGQKITIRPTHEDFPALLAEALDAISVYNDDLSMAAETLGCSATQLVNLLKEEPRAFTLFNEARQSKGLRALH